MLLSRNPNNGVYIYDYGRKIWCGESMQLLSLPHLSFARYVHYAKYVKPTPDLCPRGENS